MILNRFRSGVLVMATVVAIALVQTVRLDAARLRAEAAGYGADSVQAAADSSRSSFY